MIQLFKNGGLGPDTTERGPLYKKRIRVTAALEKWPEVRAKGPLYWQTDCCSIYISILVKRPMNAARSVPMRLRVSNRFIVPEKYFNLLFNGSVADNLLGSTATRFELISSVPHC